MPKALNIAVLIVAAGASSRLGRPKQLLPWKNSTLIGHAINTAYKLQKKQVFVVLGAHYHLIKPEIAASGVHIVKNDNWKLGLGSSIAIGIEYLTTNLKQIDGVLIMLADQPLISATYLKEMCAMLGNNKGHIIATQYAEASYGVPALFDKSYLDSLSNLSDDKGAKTLIKQHAAMVLTPTLQPEIADIDTQEDYNMLRKTNRQS